MHIASLVYLVVLALLLQQLSAKAVLYGFSLFQDTEIIRSR